MNPQQVYQNVVNEISSYLPVNPERFTIDYRIQNVLAKENAVQYQVMVAASPRETVAGYIECARAAGLKVKYVDIPENSFEKLLRYLRTKGLDISANFVVAECGETRVNVAVYRDGDFFVSRVFASGTETLVAALQEKAGGDRGSAEKLLFGRGAAPKDGADESGPLIARFLEGVAGDIIKVLDFYQERNGNHPVGAVYLAGSLAKLPGACAALSSLLKLPVSALPQLSDFMYKKKVSRGEPVDFSGLVGATFREEGRQ